MFNSIRFVQSLLCRVMGIKDVKTLKPLLAGAAVAAALTLGAGAASADTKWTVNGTFDDGTTLTGHFDINQYNFLAHNWDLFTQEDGQQGFVSHEYLPDINGFDPALNVVQFVFSDYFGEMQLTFLHNLNVASNNNPIIGEASWECQFSYACPDSPGDPTRYLVSGFASASVPEPATWGMMLLGVFGAGALVRRARRTAAVATA